jgi:hypothetical protein
MRFCVCIILTIFFTTSTFTHSASARESVEYKKFCSKITDPSTELVCAVSNKLNVDPLKVGLAMVFASVEMTGTFCNFRFSQKFLESRINVETDQEVARVVAFLIGAYERKPPPGFNGDRNVFCNLQWQTFGPRSKERFFD